MVKRICLITGLVVVMLGVLNGRVQKDPDGLKVDSINYLSREKMSGGVVLGEVIEQGYYKPLYTLIDPDRASEDIAESGHYTKGQ